MSPSKPELSMAGKWIKFWSHCAGSAASVFAAEQVPLSVLSQIVDWRSDAAVYEADLGVGLGGWAAGYWCYWTLSQAARLTPVPILELIGLAVNFFVFGELFVNVVHKECTLLLHCDSLASVVAVAFKRPKSEMMKFVVDELHMVPAYKRMEPFLAATHEAGAGNIMADAASRNYKKVITQFSQQLRIKSIHKGLSVAVRQFIQRAVDKYRSSTPVEQERSLTQAHNGDSASNPVRRPKPMLSAEHEVLPKRVDRGGNNEGASSVHVAAQAPQVVQCVAPVHLVFPAPAAVACHLMASAQLPALAVRPQRLTTVVPIVLMGFKDSEKLSPLQTSRRLSLVAVAVQPAQMVAGTMEMDSSFVDAH